MKKRTADSDRAALARLNVALTISDSGSFGACAASRFMTLEIIHSTHQKLNAVQPHLAQEAGSAGKPIGAVLLYNEHMLGDHPLIPFAGFEGNTREVLITISEEIERRGTE